MSLPPGRVVPTLTEVLDESAWQQAPACGAPPAAPATPSPVPLPESPQDLAPDQPFGPEAGMLAANDFELDLGEPAAAPPAGVEPSQGPPEAPPAQVLPTDSNAFFDALELGLRQRLGLALDLAVDELLQERVRESLERATSLLTESLLAELRQQLAPQLETLLQRALAEVLRQERDRLAR